jgi:6,7-dimethyl-8-ribityllumazine synthase
MTDAPRILILEARFYGEIADALVAGAGAVLERAGVAFDRLAVPGAFELPAAVAFALDAAEEIPDAPHYDGFVALGCVIRGETDHYDHVCRETSRALMDLAVEDGIALGFGLLTCETYEQAWVRAATDQKNKGADAAEACLRMMAVKRQLGLT